MLLTRLALPNQKVHCFRLAQMAKVHCFRLAQMVKVHCFRMAQMVKVHCFRMAQMAKVHFAFKWHRWHFKQPSAQKASEPSVQVKKSSKKPFQIIKRIAFRLT